MRSGKPPATVSRRFAPCYARTMTAADSRFMAAAIRYARRHEGWTATNPSVACLIVRDGVIVGRGVTAQGGRPHAEPLALAQAGDLARGATAYVTLEPCAHHGRTPPCAGTLISAGVARVVTATVDPDPRVDEKGHAMLREAGIRVDVEMEGPAARAGLAAYLVHKRLGRPFVTLKLAISADGLLGLRGAAQIAITGPVSRSQVHLMRARHHAILVGSGTALADDPELTCRLPGLELRSPIRIVLDASSRLRSGLKLVDTARRVPLLVAGPANPALKDSGAEFLAVEYEDGRIALPELLDDLGSRGIQSLMVEGGAEVASTFMADGLIDRIALFSSPAEIGAGHAASRKVISPVYPGRTPEGFRLTGEWRFGQDRLQIFDRAE